MFLISGSDYIGITLGRRLDSNDFILVGFNGPVDPPAVRWAHCLESQFTSVVPRVNKWVFKHLKLSLDLLQLVRNHNTAFQSLNDSDAGTDGLRFVVFSAY